ncbi:hypothetical protein HYQ40_02120 [Aerococcaceae bacterium DSM 111021]|nr:hypothetical protein [Aerococcaceae bacterium DSM 111021]
MERGNRRNDIRWGLTLRGWSLLLSNSQSDNKVQSITGQKDTSSQINVD